jgi:hypothetical protein
MNDFEANASGTIHGRRIELDCDLGFPDGQSVSLVVKPKSTIPSNYEEIVRQLSGSWADEGEELDHYLRACRREFDSDRPELEP